MFDNFIMGGAEVCWFLARLLILMSSLMLLIMGIGAVAFWSFKFVEGCIYELKKWIKGLKNE